MERQISLGKEVGNSVCKGAVVEIRALKKIDLTKYFDKVEVDLRSDLSDWHKVRKELG